MGRRDRHVEEQQEAVSSWSGHEPQGSPPPGERPVRAKERVVDIDMDVVPPSASRLVAPTSVPPPLPKTSLDGEASAIMERVLIVGDLADLSEEERVSYYKAVCKSLGLNPLTRPFAYIVLDGKLTLYARRDCTDQLRRINGISIEMVSKKVTEDVLTVHVRAMDRYGRVDEDIGAVDLYKLDGKNLANAFMKCVPLDSEILTRGGWRTFEQLRLGEDVLGFNMETGETEWTPLEAVHLFSNKEMGTLRTDRGRFQMRCTQDHRWVVQRPCYVQRSTGARKARGPYRNRRPPYKFEDCEQISAAVGLDRLLLAAPEKLQAESLLTPAEAACLGWAVTDGTIQKRGTFVRLGICQSKEANFAVIDEVVTGVSEVHTKCVTPQTIRTFPSSGNTSVCLPQHWWYLPAAVSRALLAKAGFTGRHDLPRIAASLDYAARAAMLDAMMRAEGTDRGVFTNTDINLMDTFQVLCALQGISTGVIQTQNNYEGYKLWMGQRAKKTSKIATRNLAWVAENSEPAWCPTTALGTWVMRQGGQVSITGNCLTKAKRRVTLSISGLGFADESEVEDIPQERPEPSARKGRGRPKKGTQGPREMQVVQPAKPGERKALPPLVGRKTVDAGGG